MKKEGLEVNLVEKQKIQLIWIPQHPIFKGSARYLQET